MCDAVWCFAGGVAVCCDAVDSCVRVPHRDTFFGLDCIPPPPPPPRPSLAAFFTIRYLRKRKGFASLAGEAGARLIPSYVFGQTQFFDQLSTSKGFASRLSRTLRMSLTLFWGKFGLPIPHLAPVAMVFGQPIDMTGDPDVDLAVRMACVAALVVGFGVGVGVGAHACDCICPAASGCQ